jgi:hypothetical protein
MVRITSNTGSKQAKRGRKDIADDGKETQFKKGYDPRRNMKGRPKAFDQWRELAQDIMQQIATNTKGQPLTWNGEEITFAEFVLLTWAMDKKQQEKIVEAAFGKAPQKIEGTGDNGELIIRIVEHKDDE